MLKELYQLDCLNIEKLLMSKYRELQINEKELFVLMFLFKQNKAVHTVDLSYLSRKTNFSLTELSNIIDSLMNKKLVSLEFVVHKNKEKEVINVDETFNRLENIINNEKLEEEKENIQNDISYIVEVLETEFGRNCSPLELTIIKEWFSNNVDKELVLAAIKEAVKNNKCNLNYIDSIIVNKIKNKDNVITYVKDEKFEQQVFDLIGTFKK
jgi:DnaD/phage-associated family protein